jgi:hypothetical protein
LVIGYWLLVIGYWLLVIGYWLLVVGCWVLAIKHLKKIQNSLLLRTEKHCGDWLDIVRRSKASNCEVLYWLSAVSYRLSIASGYRL